MGEQLRGSHLLLYSPQQPQPTVPNGQAWVSTACWGLVAKRHCLVQGLQHGWDQIHMDQILPGGAAGPSLPFCSGRAAAPPVHMGPAQASHLCRPAEGWHRLRPAPLMAPELSTSMGQGQGASCVPGRVQPGPALGERLGGGTRVPRALHPTSLQDRFLWQPQPCTSSAMETRRAGSRAGRASEDKEGPHHPAGQSTPPW